MFSKLFRKRRPDEAATPKGEPPPQSVAAAAPEPTGQAAKVAWERRLHASLDDEAALLALAREAPFVEIKHAAVLALASEDALKQAEREFRTHDRRVHRTAKQRLTALVERREARERASRLIAEAAALADEAIIPANRLVELDQAWRALDAGQLDTTLGDEFERRLASLKALIRERSDQQMALSRWAADARRVLAELRPCAAAVAAGGAPADELGTVGARARSVLAAAPAPLPAGEGGRELFEALAAALALSERLQTRLAMLAELEQEKDSCGAGAPGTLPDATAPEPVAATAANEPASGNEATPAIAPSGEAAAPAPIASPEQRWRALPPIDDAAISSLLEERFARWQRQRASARQSAARKAAPPKRRQEAGETVKATPAIDVAALSTAVEAASAALADGHIADAGKQLAAIDEALGDKAPPAALRARIDALHAEYGRLRGWQHWGGGRAREDLVAAAEALAKAAADENDKVPVRRQAEAIDQLRARWKELDRAGGAGNRALWQRFDAALKLAYQPVAAEHERLKAARLENLAGREALLAGLEATSMPASDDGETDWRAVARVLEEFQSAWRKLGPLEHTVPRDAREALVVRLQAAVGRLEAPLQEARRQAKAAREKFIARARALSAEAQARDTVARVRELQAEWQQHARSLPLARNVENNLWAEFKAATDAVFRQREAVVSARDAEYKAHQAEREVLIARLEAIVPETAVADIRRMLGEIDSAWRHAGEAPRAEAASLDARYRAARDAAQALIANSSRRVWQAACDALAATLARCEALEEGGANENAGGDAGEALPAVLPASWQKALQERLEAASHGRVEPDPAPDAGFDTLLLELEAALDIPSPAAFEADRRALKLRAMKNALEARQAAGVGKAEIAAMVATVLGRRTHDATRRVRLQAIVAALRVAEPLGVRG